MITKENKAKKAVEVQQATKVSYRDWVSKREEIRLQLQALKEEVSGVSDDVSKKGLIAEDTLNKFLALKPYPAQEKWQQKDLQNLKDAADLASQAVKSAELRKEDIDSKIDKLESELNNFGCLLIAKDVIEYQADIAKAEKKVLELQGLIEEQKDLILKAQPAAPDSIMDLLRMREDTLSDSLMGKATDSDLETIDRQIEAQNKKIDTQNKAIAEFNNKTAARTGQIIAGLQRKLSVAESELNLILSKREDIIYSFLMGRAEAVAEQYIKHAMALISSYKQLVALDRIIGHPSQLVGVSFDGFAIPIFKLRAFDGMNKMGSYGNMSSARAISVHNAYNNHLERQTAEEEMRAEIAAEGVKL